MDKAMLLMMLAQQAPALLNALKKPYNSPGSSFDGESPLDPMFGNMQNLTEYVGNRGYDPHLIQDEMYNLLNTYDSLDNDTSAATFAISRLANPPRGLR